MGDSKNRGKLIWLLLTARPELLPIDLKRQGRAEVHIPLFYPETLEDKKEFFRALARKVWKKKEKRGKEERDKEERGSDTSLSKYLSSLTLEDLVEVRSGADIESVLVKCKREEYIVGKRLTKERFVEIVRAFRSSISKEDLKYQIEMARAEVTDVELLD